MRLRVSLYMPVPVPVRNRITISMGNRLYDMERDMKINTLIVCNVTLDKFTVSQCLDNQNVPEKRCVDCNQGRVVRERMADRLGFCIVLWHHDGTGDCACAMGHDKHGKVICTSDTCEGV